MHKILQSRLVLALPTKYVPNLVKYINLNMQDVQQNKHKTSTVNVLCLGISFPIAAIQRYKENNESRENGT